jgi:dienelactone hydrolase
MMTYTHRAAIVFVALLAASLLGCGGGAQPPTAPAPTAAAAEPAPPEPAAPASTVVSQELSYEVGGVKLVGYLAYDGATSGPRPGVLVVHEWWGHNDYARSRADMLAKLGYTALALDMYGDGKRAAHPDDAKKFMMEVLGNIDTAEARFTAALKLLQEHETTDPQKTAAIGYCFGGAVVLHMARVGTDLDGVASFHGNLSTKSPAQKGVVKARVLVLHGAADPLVPAEQIAAFEKEMDEAGVDMKLIAYEGAKHAFTNPSATELGAKFKLPLAHHPEADQKSWAELQVFLKSLFE